MSSSIARKVEEIWRAVLTVHPGQEDATFFDLGGESIAAVRLVSRIEEEFDVWLDVGDIFEDDPTLTAVIETVVTKVANAEAA